MTKDKIELLRLFWDIADIDIEYLSYKAQEEFNKLCAQSDREHIKW